MVAGFKSESRPASNRNTRPECVGIRTRLARPDNRAGLPSIFARYPARTILPRNPIPARLGFVVHCNRTASRKAAQRLVPFLILCFLVAYLDRVNVGFAALTINKELGLSAQMFG